MGWKILILSGDMKEAVFAQGHCEMLYVWSECGFTIFINQVDKLYTTMKGTHMVWPKFVIP